MLDVDAKRKVTLIVSGEVLIGQRDTCTAVRNHICRSFSTSRTVKKDFEGQAVIKEKQAQHLILYAKAHNIWIEQLPDNYKYLTRGGESSVYLHDSLRKVVKINDAVYYAT
jgi:ATP-dependent RNA circularization protein (DNA/RNA ligase family)